MFWRVMFRIPYYCCCGINVSSRASSSFHSCNLLLLFIRWSLSRVKGLKHISPSERTRDTVTNESPIVNSLFLISILAFGKVSPWLLWTVIVHTRHSGTWSREQVPFLPSQLHFIGMIRTTHYPSKVVMLVSS